MRLKYKFSGIVQGVGFRPTIYKIAKKLNLKGYVLNSSDGVVVEIEGKNSDKFLETLKNNLPPLAKIDSIQKEILPEIHYKTFEIKNSLFTTKTTSISPDISICDECLKEMYDKNNKRYLYPFINCTNCGPRYTIIENIPYDRVNTSMKYFKMCESCQKEYKNPLNRRYHAEPISCYECGPKLSIKSKINDKWSDEKVDNKIEFIANKIKEGKIVAIKGLGGFHLVCDATNEKVVNELRIKKNRPLKSFAMMFKNTQMIKEYCEIDKFEEELILSKERPIVVVKKKKELLNVAPFIDTYGVFLPYTPIHYLLFDFLNSPIIATSANISNNPIITDSKELIEKLGGVVDVILDNDRKIINACDDSLVECVDEKVITMRLSRGYAPKSFAIKKNIKPKILAVGANQKSTITITFEDKIITSPHIGDLGSIEANEYFEKTIENFRRFYDFKEDIIICDKHPYYESTKWAKSQNKTLIQIQHHFAHALSGLFEFNLKEAIVFAFDGTGLGDDGNIWGGEVLRVNRNSFTRLHHFKYFKLIGGEKGIKNPANMSVALLNENLAKNYKNYKLAFALKNAPFPLTSSVGRLFDIVAFLGGFIEKNEYEGFSGMVIEKYYNPLIQNFIDLEVKEEIDFYPLIEFSALNRGNFELISSTFLNSLAYLIQKISKNYNLPILLTGGVFQNKTLIKLLKNFYFNQKIPINDAGISIGQAVYGVWNF